MRCSLLPATVRDLQAWIIERQSWHVNDNIRSFLILTRTEFIDFHHRCREASLSLNCLFCYSFVSVWFVLYLFILIQNGLQDNEWSDLCWRHWWSKIRWCSSIKVQCYNRWWYSILTLASALELAFWLSIVNFLTCFILLFRSRVCWDWLTFKFVREYSLPRQWHLLWVFCGWVCGWLLIDDLVRIFR